MRRSGIGKKLSCREDAGEMEYGGKRGKLVGLSLCVFVCVANVCCKCVLQMCSLRWDGDGDVMVMGHCILFSKYMSTVSQPSNHHFNGRHAR